MQIRIIPMSLYDETFVGKSIEEIQKDFFKDYLINVLQQELLRGFVQGKSNIQIGDEIAKKLNAQNFRKKTKKINAIIYNLKN